MAIKLLDLPKNVDLSKEEMLEISGGGSSTTTCTTKYRLNGKPKFTTCTTTTTNSEESDVLGLGKIGIKI